MGVNVQPSAKLEIPSHVIVNSSHVHALISIITCHAPSWICLPKIVCFSVGTVLGVYHWMCCIRLMLTLLVPKTECYMKFDQCHGRWFPGALLYKVISEPPYVARSSEALISSKKLTGLCHPWRISSTWALAIGKDYMKCKHDVCFELHCFVIKI